MDVVVLNGDIGNKSNSITGVKKSSQLNLFLNKCLFFLIGASVTCVASTGRLTSKAFGTTSFISECFSVYIYINLFAFLIVLLLVDCNYKKAVIASWMCLTVHVLYTLISAFATGNIGRNLYISMYAVIAILEAFVIQSNSYVVSTCYSSSIFSNLYSGYYGGLAIFSLIQTFFQFVVGTNTQRQARLCLILTHGSFSLVVFGTALTQTIIYLKNRHVKMLSFAHTKLAVSCLNKIKGMYTVLLSMPRYFSRFIVFVLSDLCKCAFFQVFIPYRMLLSDKQLTVIFFVDNICDIAGRSLASYADDTVVSKGKVLNHKKFLYKRDVMFLIVPILCWILSFMFVWATWTLKVRFLVKFAPILIATVIVCFSVGYCSTRGINGCIPILEYFSQQYDDQGSKMYPELSKDHYSYVNDLNTFLTKLLWVIVFIVVYFLSKLMEKRQNTQHYVELKELILS